MKSGSYFINLCNISQHHLYSDSYPAALISYYPIGRHPTWEVNSWNWNGPSLPNYPMDWFICMFSKQRIDWQLRRFECGRVCHQIIFRYPLYVYQSYYYSREGVLFHYDLSPKGCPDQNLKLHFVYFFHWIHVHQNGYSVKHWCRSKRWICLFMLVYLAALDINYPIMLDLSMSRYSPEKETPTARTSVLHVLNSLRLNQIQPDPRFSMDFSIDWLLFMILLLQVLLKICIYSYN